MELICVKNWVLSCLYLEKDIYRFLQEFLAMQHSVFLIYSSEDFSKADDIREKLCNANYKTYSSDEDFIPGHHILDNIWDTIRKSDKYIFVITDNFTKCPICELGAEWSVWHTLDMQKSKVIIPLLSCRDTQVPYYLMQYEKIYLTDENWFDTLRDAIDTPIEEKNVGTKPFQLENEKQFHYVSISHKDDIILKSWIDQLIREGFKGKCLQIQRARPEGRSIQEANSNQNAIGSMDSVEYRIWEDDEVQILSTIPALEKISTCVKQSTKVIVWFGEKFTKDKTSYVLLKSLLTSMNDIKESPFLIPIILGDIKARQTPETINHITHISVRDESDENEEQERFTTTVARPDAKKFPRKKESAFRVHADSKIFRVSEFEMDKTSRYLGISFIERNGNLVLLDADNKCLQKFTILGENIRECKLDQMPNRLSKADDNHLVLLYRDDNKILVFETNTMVIEERRVIHGMVLKGISAINKDDVIVSATRKGSFVFALIHKEEVQHIIDSDPLDPFAMPRRLTKLDESSFVAADENDRRLMHLKVEHKKINFYHKQEKWQKNLYNVRGLAADDKTVYVASCNGVMTFDNDLGFKHRLIQFHSNVYHTRALALFSMQTRKFLAVTQAVENKDGDEEGTEIVRVFDITYEGT